MKIKTRRNRPASIAKTRWVAYAAAGAATALAGNNSAEAAIHYSGIVNKKFPPDKTTHHKFSLDQPRDSLFFERINGSFFNSANFLITGIVSAHVRGVVSSSQPFVYKLSYGQNISGGHFTFSFSDDPGILAACRSGVFLSWVLDGSRHRLHRF